MAIVETGGSGVKRRVFSWILAGALLFQSVNVEAAQPASYAGLEQGMSWQTEKSDSGEYRGEASEKTGSTDGEEMVSSDGEGLRMESLQDGEGLFQAGSFQIQERGSSGIALFSAAEDEQWKEWDAYVCEHLKAKETVIDVKDFQVPTDQFSAWYYGVVNEHPELYFVNSRISYMPMGNIVSAVMPAYQEGYDDAAFAQAAKEALSVVTEDMTDVQKAVALHDYLVVNCEYDYENLLNKTIPAESYTAYGALVKGVSVCQGYALAYKYLLQEVGIPCYMVSSSTMNHAWNMVELGGQLYQVDVTWDDPTWDSLGRVRHNNMFVSDRVLEERQEHSGWEIAYRGEKVDFQALDTTYDEFFWTNVTSPLILWGAAIITHTMMLSKKPEVSIPFRFPPRRPVLCHAGMLCRRMTILGRGMCGDLLPIGQEFFQDYSSWVGGSILTRLLKSAVSNRMGRICGRSLLRT